MANRQTTTRLPMPGLGLILASLTLLAGCRHPKPPGALDVPPGLPAPPGVYTDINPRWSHDGKRIAFLRATPDRRLQLALADAGLSHPRALLEAELVCPDRPYSPGLRRYASPDTLAWSPDDRRIAFARPEWFTFEDGERLPGTGLWALNLTTGRVTPLALHPKRYLSVFYYYHAPQWSPDGRYLAFAGEGINGQRVIFVRTLTAQKAQEVRPRFDNYADSDWPIWEPPRPDSDASDSAPILLFRQGLRRTPSVPPTETLRRLRPGGDSAESGELWRITAAEYGRLLASPAPPDTVIAPRSGHPVWSPDGQRIAFTLTPDADDFTRYEVWTINRDGSGARRVSPADGRGYFAPVWIDRERLGALSPQGAQYAVVLLNNTTGATRTLGVLSSADCDWSPDRSQIVYAPPTPSNPDADAESPTTLRLLATGLSVPPPYAPAYVTAAPSSGTAK